MQNVEPILETFYNAITNETIVRELTLAEIAQMEANAPQLSGADNDD